MVKRNSFLTIEILDDMFDFTWTCRLQEGIIKITLERWGNYCWLRDLLLVEVQIRV